MGERRRQPNVAENRFNLAAAEAGLPFNLDAWDGYPAARERLLRSALDANANLIVLSGDTHNAWAFDLDLGGSAAGVEFGRVTSPASRAACPRSTRRSSPGRWSPTTGS